MFAHKKRTGLKITLIVLFVLMTGIGIYLFKVYSSFTEAVDMMYMPIREKSDKRIEKIELRQSDPFSVLLLGVDQWEGDRGRSDTMIIMAVNPNNESIEMVSIPRDTRTEIIGKGFEDKINHAFAYGGVEMSINTVENFLDIPIDYFIQINLEGFEEIVDAVGGVTVQNDLEFTYGGVHFPLGEITLNGEEALIYSRMRSRDPRGDFGRQKRQRSVIEAIIRKGASFNTLANFDHIFQALGKNIKTNLSIDQILDIQQNYKQAANHITQHQIDGSGKMIDGIYYYIVPEEEKLSIQGILKEQLEIIGLAKTDDDTEG